MPDVRYTHGHHESVLRSHRWRTADNSAGYLLPHLRAGQALLDVGCGPGTITADLAERVAPGPVVGLDASSQVLLEARAAAAERARGRAHGKGRVGTRVGIRVGTVAGDVLRLPFPGGAFDVVHAHQVLQHLGDPVGALVEMRRACRPGGLVAARDSDYPQMAWHPAVDAVARAFEAYGRVTASNGAHWDAGRRLLSWAQAAGFTEVRPSASVWCFATPAERHWWGGLWAERVTRSALAEQMLATGVYGPDELEEFAAGFRRWAGAPDGWFTVVHGEVLARA